VNEVRTNLYDGGREWRLSGPTKHAGAGAHQATQTRTAVFETKVNDRESRGVIGNASWPTSPVSTDTAALLEDRGAGSSDRPTSNRVSDWPWPKRGSSSQCLQDAGEANVTDTLFPRSRIRCGRRFLVSMKSGACWVTGAGPPRKLIESWAKAGGDRGPTSTAWAAPLGMDTDACNDIAGEIVGGRGD
jgi:hypothetical protein